MSGKKGKTGVWKDSSTIANRKKQLIKAGLKTRFVKGHVISAEMKNKISKTNKKNGVGKWMSNKRGEKSNNWKGDSVGYGGLHDWIKKSLGEPSNCEECGDNEQKRYEWANISGEYKRDFSDWIRLCVKCHRKKDDWVNKAIKKKGGVLLYERFLARRIQNTN